LPQEEEQTVPTATLESDDLVAGELDPTRVDLPTPENLPTPEDVPTLDAGEIAQLLATPLPQPTQPTSATAVSTGPGPQVAPGPEIASTPAGASTPDPGFAFEPGAGDANTPEGVGARVLPPTATAAVIQPTVAVQPGLIQPTIALVSLASTFSTSSASVYQYSVGPGQAFEFENIRLGDGVRLFLPNPVDGNSWIRTDHYGILRYRPIGAPQEGVMSHSPYFAGFGAPSIDQNKNRVVELDWSADGTQFSFRIDPPPNAEKHGDVGVWFWQPLIDPVHHSNYMIVRDCPAENYGSCSLVGRVGPIWHWKTRAVDWSPVRGSNTVLLTFELPDEGRNALAIAQAVRDRDYAQRQPNFVRYDYGHWNLNGQGIIVSGRRPDGRVIIGEVNNDLTGERVILDASALGLWLRDAARRPNGQIVALGRPGAPGSGPVALYDGAGRQISGFIGDAPPEDVRWFPNRSSVVVSVRGRQYTVQAVGGSIIEASERLRAPQFSASEFGSSTIPSGVIQGSEYYPGQQLRTVIPFLNIRENPSTAATRVGQLVQGDYVAILAGPHQSDGYPWWKVQTADFTIGWIAGLINGAPSIRSP